MRAALYIRVSTEEQARHGLSLAEQKESLERYAKAHEMDIVGIYEDAGISARKPYKKRPALLRLLEDCKSGKIDIILFIKLDRWFRNVAGYYDVQTQLDKYGVTWQATKEDYETRTASGRLKVNIMLSVAQDEADRTSERIRFINDGKRAKGMPTVPKAPIGIMIKDRVYQIDPDTAEMAKDIYASYIRLRSLLALKRNMFETRGIDRAYKNNERALKNRLYIGEAYGIENALPALISKEDFAIASEIMRQRSQRCASTREDHTYLFSGIICCKECGKTMQPETVKGYRYYRCRTRSVGTSQCPHHRRIREDAVEDFVLHGIEEISARYHGNYNKAQKKPAQSADKIRRKMQKLKDLYLADLIELEDYRKDYEDLKQQLSSIESQALPGFDLQSLKKEVENYGTLSRQLKKEFWTRTVKRIDADDNGAFFITPR